MSTLRWTIRLSIFVVYGCLPAYLLQITTSLMVLLALLIDMEPESIAGLELELKTRNL